MPHLDSDLLRTFLAIVEGGSITAGAKRIARSQSAASLQLKQLEAIVGEALLERHGRGVAPTSAGERLLPTARQVTASLDAALATFRQDAFAGRVRLGIAEALASKLQAAVLAAFCRRHPRVELEVQCALGDGFGAAVTRGRLDLALYETPDLAARHRLVREERLVWMGASRHDTAQRDPLPLAVFDRACWWRDAALADIAATGRRSRIMFTSESAAGVRAAASAGMAVALLNERHLGPDLVALPEIAAPKASFLVLDCAAGAQSPAVLALADAVHDAAARL